MGLRASESDVSSDDVGAKGGIGGATESYHQADRMRSIGRGRCHARCDRLSRSYG
jgi:hypothetical protein